MTVIEEILMELIRAQRLLEKGPCAKFLENPTGGLISDARSDGRAGVVSISKGIDNFTHS
jgi:hypothetical protein